MFSCLENVIAPHLATRPETGAKFFNSLTQLYRQVGVTCYISALCRTRLFAGFAGNFLRIF